MLLGKRPTAESEKSYVSYVMYHSVSEQTALSADRLLFVLQKNNNVGVPLSSRHERQQWCNYHELIVDDRVSIDKAIGVTRDILEFFL